MFVGVNSGRIRGVVERSGVGVIFRECPGEIGRVGSSACLPCYIDGGYVTEETYSVPLIGRSMETQ